MEENKDEKGGGYADSLMSLSLDLCSNGLDSEIGHEGLCLLLHLWTCRKDDLSADDWSNAMPILSSCIMKKLPCHHEDKGQLLLMEHIMLSKTFITVASSPRTESTEALLTYLLKILNKIWTQPDWEEKYTKYCLADLLANDDFTAGVHLLVKSFEELTSNSFVVSKEECSSASAPYFYSHALAKLMLHLILQVLNCIQIYWEEPLIYDLSRVRAENISILRREGMLSDIDEVNLLKNTKTWLHGIRVTGYNVIGLCASLDGSFYGLLDRSFIMKVLMKKLRSMEFIHLGKLIELVIVPLIKYCPQTCWDEWMLELLEPVFGYCEDISYHAWFTFLHEGRPQAPPYFGILRGPDEIVIQFEKEILLKFTRSVSDLLWAISSKSCSELSLLPLQLKDCLKNDSQELKNNSLTGYLLHHNCFGKLSMYLLGCLVDYEAVKKALPFCNALIDLAVAANHEWLRLFICNEMLPTIILLLDDFPCAISRLISSLNPKTKEDARSDITHLCQRIFEAYIDKQVVLDEGEVTKTLPVCFKNWLAKELTDLHMRAYCNMPEKFPKDFEWKWERNEEFERYLPTYMNILMEVESMDDCLEGDYLSHEFLFDNLKPEFKSRYAINSYVHPCLRTMTRMLQRKMPAVYYQKRTEWITQFLTQLIKHKPYIKLTDCWENIFECIEENCEFHFDPPLCNPAWALDIFLDSILFFWEPQFHPLIREGHTELLQTIAQQLAFAEGSSQIEPLEPHPDDFLEHLWPYAYAYIKRKKEESGYFDAEKQVQLHKEFDEHLASGTLDHRMTEFIHSKDDFVHNIVADFTNCSFETLDPDLIRMSFERRVTIVEWERKMSYYLECLKFLQNNEKMEKQLGSLISSLDAEGFFKVDDDSIDWNNKSFSDSIEKFDKVVFYGKLTDKCLVIRGIMDYKKILELGAVNWQDAVRMVVRDNLWKEHLQQFWMETRHYEHKYYDILAQPLQKVFLSGEA